MTLLKPSRVAGYFMIVLSVCAVAGADTIWIGQNAKNPIEADGVKIQEIDADQIVFVSSGGITTTKLPSEIQQIAIDGEAAFNAAEESFRDGKLSDAANSYNGALHSSSNDWVKMRSALRLASAAAATNRFDGQVSAYIYLMQKDPSQAGKWLPKLSDANSTSLDSSVEQLTQILSSSSLTDSQRADLLQLALQIYRAKKDASWTYATLAQLVKLNAATPGDLAVYHLLNARTALDTRDYQKALNEIQQNRALFVDPVEQIDALLAIAQAQDGLVNRSEAAGLQDVAIAYMRVVTFGKDVPGQPHVSDALLRVGQIEEELKNSAEAAQVYQQIVKDYPGQPAAAAARTGIERLANHA